MGGKGGNPSPLKSTLGIMGKYNKEDLLRMKPSAFIKLIYKKYREKEINIEQYQRLIRWYDKQKNRNN